MITGQARALFGEAPTLSAGQSHQFKLPASLARHPWFFKTELVCTSAGFPVTIA